jgi:hypothetical protein
MGVETQVFINRVQLPSLADINITFVTQTDKPAKMFCDVALYVYSGTYLLTFWKQQLPPSSHVEEYYVFTFLL